MQFEFYKDGGWYQVLAKNAYDGKDVAVYTWASHIDGPIEPEAKYVLDQMAAWSGGYRTPS